MLTWEKRNALIILVGVYNSSMSLENNVPMSGQFNKDVNIQKVPLFCTCTIEILTVIHRRLGKRMSIRMLFGRKERGRK